MFSRFLVGTLAAVVLALTVVAVTLPRMAMGLLLSAKQHELLDRGAEVLEVASAYLGGTLPEDEAASYLSAVGSAGDVEVWVVDSRGTIVLDLGQTGWVGPSAAGRSPVGPSSVGPGPGGPGHGRMLRGHQLSSDETASVLGGQPWCATGLRWPFSDPVVSVAVPVRAPGGDRVLGAVFLHTPVSGVAATAAQLRRDLLLAAGVGLAASFVAAVVLSRNVTGPIGEMSRMAGRIAQGDLDVRAPECGPAEVARLGRALNSMAAGLAASREESRRLEAVRRDLVTSVSHDLRTPITAIRGYTEPLLDGTVTDEATRRRYLETIRAETEALSALVTDLLELNRLEAGAASLKLAPVDVGQLAREAAARFAVRSEASGVALRTDVAPDVPPVLADEGRIARVIANLLDNAFKFTPRGGEVQLGVRADEGYVVIAVRDTGPGIAPADLPHIWERFYKADRSRHRGREPGDSAGWTSDGSGLGLAIVKETAEAHSGWVEVTSEPGRGAEFRVLLPKQAPPADGRAETVP